MPRSTITAAGCAVAAFAALAGAGSASAQAPGTPTGIWVDHTGRGAVEITECGGGALCGHVVWVKDAKHLNTCRNQVLGGVKPVGGNTWDRGWIIDPDDDSKYSVELKPVGSDRLRVVGYMGSKLFSETMTWKRAPADLTRCDGKTTPAATPASVPAAAVPAKSAAIDPASSLPEEVIRPGQISPNEPATSPLPAPQRQAAAPAVIPPGATTRPAAPVIVMPPEETAPIVRPATRRAETEPLPAEVEPEPASPRGTKKNAKRNCKLDLPGITLTYPCDAF